VVIGLATLRLFETNPVTDDDLTYAEGKDDELVGKLQKKLGKSAEEVRHILEG